MPSPIGLCPGPGGTRPWTAEVVLAASRGRNCCALLSLLLSRCTDASKVRTLVKNEIPSLGRVQYIVFSGFNRASTTLLFEAVEFNSENIYNKILSFKAVIQKRICNFIIENFPTKMILANLLCDENKEFFMSRQDLLNPRCQMSTWDTQKLYPDIGICQTFILSGPTPDGDDVMVLDFPEGCISFTSPFVFDSVSGILAISSARLLYTTDKI